MPRQYKGNRRDNQEEIDQAKAKQQVVMELVGI